MGRLPWLALFFLRARRLRPVLPMSLLNAGPGGPNLSARGKTPVSQVIRVFAESSGMRRSPQW